MTTPVLDASAILALLYREPGHDVVAGHLADAVVSAVNWSEVVQKLAQRGHPSPEGAANGLLSLGVRVALFDERDAVAAAKLWPTTRSAGLSLGDRACLAVASNLSGVAVTADQAWAELDLAVPIQLIR
ncbi:type II toxin-antitoxin system VapC family toxin [Amycolatopsis sp. NPDC058986]|uniref:type II toxin-antitoxin system VapC family toxin n=1 Tax=unclassified Amycolatopsis TaxID=2618356 RepID=UPI00366A5B6F